MLWRFRFFTHLVSAAICVSARLVAGEPDLAAMKRLVRSRFPEVPQVSTAELQAWLDDSHRPRPLLLDVRTGAEYEVSHLPDASRVDPSSKAADVLPYLPAGRPIVTYCSVGYRSSAMAQKLMKAGVKDVSNLEGSIFEWANEHRPLVAKGQPATKVHPYNATFGKLLAPDRRGQPEREK